MKISAVGRPWGQWWESATRCRRSSSAAISGGDRGWPALIAALQATMCKSSASNPSRVGGNGRVAQVFGEVADQAIGDHVREHRRQTPHQHRIAAERLDIQPELSQHLDLLQDRRRLGGRQVHRLGDQQPLRLDLTMSDSAP